MHLPVSQRGHALLMAMSPPGTDPSTIPTPDWLMERSARFEPIWRSFREATLDIEALQSFPAPVYLPVGGKSHPRFPLAASFLASVSPHSWVDIYHGQTHLEAPPTVFMIFGGAIILIALGGSLALYLWGQTPPSGGGEQWNDVIASIFIVFVGLPALVIGLVLLLIGWFQKVRGKSKAGHLRLY